MMKKIGNVSPEFSEERIIINIGPDFKRRLRYRIAPKDPIGRPPSSVYGRERKQLLGYDNYIKAYFRE